MHIHDLFLWDTLHPFVLQKTHCTSSHLCSCFTLSPSRSLIRSKRLKYTSKNGTYRKNWELNSGCHGECVFECTYPSIIHWEISTVSLIHWGSIRNSKHECHGMYVYSWPENQRHMYSDQIHWQNFFSFWEKNMSVSRQIYVK